jgi:hypothetical protein
MLDGNNDILHKDNRKMDMTYYPIQVFLMHDLMDHHD